MKFLIDENIRKEVLDFLRSSGYDVESVPRGCPDIEIARIAKAEKRIIVTHDVHFSNILLYPPEKFFGIIRIRIHPPNAEIIIKALTDLLEKLPSLNIEKKLVILERDSFRIR